MKDQMEKHLPYVSIVIACRNEKKFIGKCLDSINSNHYPKDKLEVLVVDGMSDDGTREIVDGYLMKYPFVKLIDNTQKITPVAFNVGINNSIGEILMIMSAHTMYDPDYISKCVGHLLKHPEVDNVGGVCVTLPGNESLISHAIAIGLSNSFGVGNSYFRIGSNRERYVDTVPFGCYRKDVFAGIGLFDEDLLRTQDSELNARLIKYGGRILLVPEIVSHYHARASLLSLWKMQFQYGYFKPLAAKKIGKIFAFRHTIPPLFVAALIVLSVLSLFHKIFFWLFIAVLLPYLAVNLLVSFRIALKKNLKFVFVLPFTFIIIHIGWGLGFLKGILDFVILKKCVKKNIPITR